MSASIVMRMVLIGSTIGFVLCLVAYVFTRKRKVYNDSIFTKEKKNVSLNMWYWIYPKLTNFPLTRKYAVRVHKQFELFFPGDERAIVVMTTKVIILVLSVIVSLIALILLIHPSVYLLLCGFITIIVINEQTIQAVVNRNEMKLLEELNVFTDLVQFNYLQSRMIDEALYDSLIGKNKLAERHGSQILKVLQADDLDDELNRYNNSVTNEFLREFMCICVTTFVYGDTDDDGRSRFLESLKSLKDRLGESSTRKSEVRFQFRMLPLLCIVPMFTLEFISNWAIETISELEAYYNGYYGLIATIICVLSSIASYFVVNYLKDAKLADLSDHAFLTWISQLPFLKRMLAAYFDRNFGLKIQFERMLKQTGSRLTANTLMIKRLLYGMVAMLGTIILCAGMHLYTRERITSQVTGTGSKSSAASESDSIVMMMMIRGYTDKYLDYDAVAAYNEMLMNSGNEDIVLATTLNSSVEQFWLTEMVTDFNSGDGCNIPEEVALQVVQQYNKEHASSTRLYTAYLGTGTEELREYDEDMMQEAEKQMEKLRMVAEGRDALELITLDESVARDVIKRVKDYQNSYFHWYEMLLAILIGVAAFWVPYIWLLYTKRESQQLMENEVLQFQALVMILTPIRRMSAPLMMDWVLMFAEIFRPSIHKCIVELPADEQKAFDDLIAAEPYAPFQELIRKMQMCDKVGVAKAFYNMEVTNRNFIEHRKQSERMRLETNSVLAQMLVFVPIGAVLFIYLIIPFMVESFGQLTSTMTQMTNL